MYKIDNASAAAALPAPGGVGPQPDGFFASGVTVVDADWLNAVQEELAYAILQSPGTPALSKTDRTQLKTAIDAYIAAGAGIQTNELYYLEDQKTDGTAGGTPSGGVWNKRDLNAELVANITGASVAASVITLPAGTYWIEFACPAYSGEPESKHQARFRNTSDSTTAVLGASGGRIKGDNVINVYVSDRALGAGLFTIAASKNFELQHYYASNPSDGFGYPSSTGAGEVYSQLKIWKVA